MVSVAGTQMRRGGSNHLLKTKRHWMGLLKRVARKRSLGCCVPVLLIGTLLGGCGTDPLPHRGAVQLQGSFTEKSGVEPLTVTDANSGVSTQTDSGRGFVLLVDPKDGVVELLIVSARSEDMVTVSGLPAQGTVQVTFATGKGGEWEATIRGGSGQEAPPGNDGAPATPTPSGDFLANGDTIRFGIPSGIVGNKNRGRGRWQKECGVCHGELGRRWVFGRLKRRIAEPPMNLILDDRLLADIVAYLNR